MSRAHVVLAIAVAVVLPLAGKLSGHEELTFSMFSFGDGYRLAFTTVDATGQGRPLAPTAVAAAVGGSLGNLLAGTERFRRAPFGSLLRRRLDEVARFACRARPDAVRVDALLELRRTRDGPVTTFRADEPCR